MLYKRKPGFADCTLTAFCLSLKTHFESSKHYAKRKKTFTVKIIESNTTRTVIYFVKIKPRFQGVQHIYLTSSTELVFFQHTIHVVATDGNDVEAESAQSIIMSSGERFDILVKTDGNPRKNYFIRAETIEVKNRHNVSVHRIEYSFFYQKYLQAFP